MPNLLLDHPTPNFDELVRVLKGEQSPQRVHLVEVGIDPEVLQTIQEAYFFWKNPDGYAADAGGAANLAKSLLGL